MPPVLPNPADRMLAALGRTANTARALATQPNLTFANPDGQIAISTGQLQQYPTSGSNYSSGYGLEVPINGLESAPSIRIGLISWTSPAGTRTIEGFAYYDANGYLRLAWGAVTLGGTTTRGAQVFDTSGNQVGFIPYFSGGTYAGEINF